MIAKVGDTFGCWKVVGRLGSGGQGIVYKVMGQDGIREGALKHFSIRGSQSRRTEALNRLKREVEVLGKLDHPNIVKLLDSDIGGGWIVMDYLANGTLAYHLSDYRGDAVSALRAIRPLIEGAALLHHIGIVHRDIKLQNIFVASDGRLVLGDFGIAFENAGSGPRITETNERVGSRDWISPWADVRHRMEEPKATLDVFSLSKVLWCMLSGINSLPLWYHQKATNDLTLLFQEQMVQQVRQGRTPQMAAINWILDSCIVENEDDCHVRSAKQLLGLVDSYLWAWTGPAERGSHWRYYYAERSKELYEGISERKRQELTAQYRAAYLARDSTLPGDIFIDWNVQSEIMDDLMRDESIGHHDVKLWSEVVAGYFRV